MHHQCVLSDVDLLSEAISRRTAVGLNNQVSVPTGYLARTVGRLLQLAGPKPASRRVSVARPVRVVRKQ